MNYKPLKLLRYSITVSLIFLLAYLVDLNSLTTQIINAKIEYVVLAVFVFLSIYIWSSLRWRSLLSGLGYSLSFYSCLKVIIISYGFNKILPLNSGDLTRSKIMERYTEVENHGEILGAVAMERFLDVLLLGFITAISSIKLLGGSKSVLWLLLLSSGLISVMIYARLNKKLFTMFLDFADMIGVPEKIINLLKDGLDGFAEIPKSKLPEIMLWHSLRWGTGILVLYIISVSVNAPLTLTGAALITGVMSLTAALPITPGGIGPVEALSGSILVLIGLSVSQASAVVVLQRSLGLVLMGVLGALVYSLD